MSRPQGDPTHYVPAWLDGDGYFIDADGADLGFSSSWTLAIPAERVTVTPEPYTPKAGDRVATDLGYEATLLTGEPLEGRLAVRFHIPDGSDRYTTIDPAIIQGPA